MLPERDWFRRVIPRLLLCALPVLLEALIRLLPTPLRVHLAIRVSLASTLHLSAAFQQTSPALCALLATCVSILLRLRIPDAPPIRFVQLALLLRSFVLLVPTALTTQCSSHALLVPSVSLAPSVHPMFKLLMNLLTQAPANYWALATNLRYHKSC